MYPLHPPQALNYPLQQLILNWVARKDQMGLGRNGFAQGGQSWAERRGDPARGAVAVNRTRWAQGEGGDARGGVRSDELKESCRARRWAEVKEGRGSRGMGGSE